MQLLWQGIYEIDKLVGVIQYLEKMGVHQRKDHCLLQDSLRPLERGDIRKSRKFISICNALLPFNAAQLFIENYLIYFFLGMNLQVCERIHFGRVM